MQHTIPVTQLTGQVGPQIEEMVGAIETCVHCGFCLSACPTYSVLGQEMDSPRGRIFLMKSVLEGELAVQEAMPYIDRCLGCLACVTACPSGVQYGELVAPFRAFAQAHTPRSLMHRVQSKLIKQTLPYPARFRSAAAIGKFVKPLRGALPDELGGMLELIPGRLPEASSFPALVPAEGERRARVALLTGCVQQVLAPEINWATLRVLAKNGVEIIIPEKQVCCGALHMHTGDYDQARRFARENLKVFPGDVDVILTNAAGCGSGMKEYGLLFKGFPEQQEAQIFSKRIQDVSEFLVELGLTQPLDLPQPLRVSYHDACHLAHAQGITEAPRRLLSSISNLTLLEIADGSTCCGSAGIYNLEQPAIAAELGKRKAQNILRNCGEAIVAGNIGCIVQIQTHLKLSGKLLPVFHTLELLDMAYSQADPKN